MTTGSIITYCFAVLFLIAAIAIIFSETKKPKQARNNKATILALVLSIISSLIIFIHSLIQSLS